MVNQQFSFAVHILTLLAYAGQVLDSRTLARSVNTNPVVVRRLLCALKRARLVKTFAGKHGGAVLARPANQIKLADIYDALEPRPPIMANQRRAFRRCPVSCQMQAIMTGIASSSHRAVRNQLGTVTIGQLVQRIR